MKSDMRKKSDIMMKLDMRMKSDMMMKSDMRMKLDMRKKSDMSMEANMNIIISFQSGVAAYEQIKEQIKVAIMSGELAEGEMLPSMRQLARDLKVSNITTTRAYGDLEAEGLIYTVQGRGCYVKGLPQEIVREQYLREIGVALDMVAVKAKAAGLTIDDLQAMIDAAWQ
jgi:GntR family transcriptional regulator